MLLAQAAGAHPPTFPAAGRPGDSSSPAGAVGGWQLERPSWSLQSMRAWATTSYWWGALQPWQPCSQLCGMTAHRQPIMSQVDNRHQEKPVLTAEQARRLCDRNFGIGGDGVRSLCCTALIDIATDASIKLKGMLLCTC